MRKILGMYLKRAFNLIRTACNLGRKQVLREQYHKIQKKDTSGVTHVYSPSHTNH